MKNRRNLLTTVVATAALGSAALFAPAASAGSDVAWSLSFGGPGFGVNVAQPAYGGYYGAPYRPYYRPVVVAPPVYYRPAPVVYRPVVVAPRPVVVAPRPAYYAPAAVVYGPRGYAPASVRTADFMRPESAGNHGQLARQRTHESEFSYKCSGAFPTDEGQLSGRCCTP